MKTLIALFYILLAFQAKAQGPSYSEFYSMPADSYSVSPLCPTDMVCVTDGTVIDIQYTVQCTESIVSFTYDAIEKDGELHVYVSAVAGTNPPQDLTCLAFHQEVKNITLINQYGKVVVHELGVSGSSVQ